LPKLFLHQPTGSDSDVIQPPRVGTPLKKLIAEAFEEKKSLKEELVCVAAVG